MNESGFYNWLKTNCVSIKLKRVETKGRDGFPDLFYVNQSTHFQGLIELKAVARMPRNLRGTGLEVEQNIFHYDLARDGGVSYLLCWSELEQAAALWEGKDIFPAWKSNTLGTYLLLPKANLPQLSNYVR